MKKRIGVYVCHCGGNISDYVDTEKVKNAVKNVDGVFLSKETMFACADSAQKEIANDIKNENLDAIVVASCSPKLHLPTFRSVAERAGLNPYNYVQVNIREQCSWAHSDDKQGATEKAIQLIKAGIANAFETEPLEPIKIPTLDAVAVVGAGVGGMRSAIALADMGTDVYLIEREFFVGGRMSQWGKLFTSEETGQELVTRLYKEIIKRKNIIVFTGAEIIEKSGSIGNFVLKVKINPRYVRKEIDYFFIEKAIQVCPVEVDDEFNFGLTKRKAIYKHFPSEFPRMPAIDIKHCTKCGECEKVCRAIDFDQKEKILSLNAGFIIVNTGFDPYEPPKGEYAYKEIDNVITLQQMMRLIELNDEKLIFNGKEIKKIAYIYCVGSREKDKEDGNKYCSRYCCTSALHTALVVKNKYKDIANIHIHRGIRTYGKQELIFEESSKQGDIHLQFSLDSIPTVEKLGEQTIIKVKDILTAGRLIETDADLVVLVTAMTPKQDNKIGDLLKLPKGRDKFFNEIHMKLRPVETVIDGVLIAGTCQGPKNIMETLNSSLAAAAKAHSVLVKGELSLEPKIARIDSDACTWCDICTEACPYVGAIFKADYNGKLVANINDAICKGCGMCTPVCPLDAIDIIGFNNAEIEGMIDALIEA